MFPTLYIDNIQINFGVSFYSYRKKEEEWIRQTVKMKENMGIIWKNCVNISRITNNVNYARSDCQTQLHSEEWSIFIVV